MEIEIGGVLWKLRVWSRMGHDLQYKIESGDGVV